MPDDKEQQDQSAVVVAPPNKIDASNDDPVTVLNRDLDEAVNRLRAAKAGEAPPSTVISDVSTDGGNFHVGPSVSNEGAVLVWKARIDMARDDVEDAMRRMREHYDRLGREREERSQERMEKLHTDSVAIQKSIKAATWIYVIATFALIAYQVVTHK
jgi:hypothetical protein